MSDATCGNPPRTASSFLAFDFGIKRIGVAVGNSFTRTARPLQTIAANGDARFDAIRAVIDEWQPSALVVGVPFHPDGAAHENTIRARRFARQLHGRFGLQVHEVDERYTTTEATSRGWANQGAASPDLDAASAAIILEQFLCSDVEHNVILSADARNAANGSLPPE